MTWEYKLVLQSELLSKGSDIGPRERFNTLGAMGWELVSIHQNEVFIFKRPATTTRSEDYGVQL